jgi:hypothetical protein
VVKQEVADKMAKEEDANADDLDLDLPSIDKFINGAMIGRDHVRVLGIGTVISLIECD